jgi:pimeloyl-ACP methyl ester carboxylesterase
MRARHLLLLVSALLLQAACGSAPAGRDGDPGRIADWPDPSPHRAGFARRGGVALHYLDWGGGGEPIVLIPGLGSTAHTFDDFAPRLTDRWRVVAVTRRGFGESGRPEDGYDTASLAADVLAVMDRLGVQRATLVGHSMGGAEAVWLAVHHPERVARVVLLESYCYQCELDTPTPTDPPDGDAPPRPTAGPADRASAEALAAFDARLSGARAPAAEISATHVVGADGRIGARNEAPHARSAVRGRLARSRMDRVRAPMLLVLSLPTTPEDEVRWARPLTGEERRWAEWSLRLHRWQVHGWRELFRRMQPDGTVRWVAGGAHHVYLSHPDQVARLLGAFRQ